MKLKDFMLTKISQTEKNKNIVRFYLDKIFRIGKFREVKKRRTEVPAAKA